MGRIADALKRAEQERRRAGGASACATLDTPTGPGAPARLASGPVEGIAPQWSDSNNREADTEVTIVQGLSESLVPYYERSSLVTEQYRSLRTRLLSDNPHFEHQTIAITSAVPKEGKSVTTLNLGCILAELRHLRVLVVDGDFRRGSLAHMLNQPDGPGLAEALDGKVTFSDVLRKTPIGNLMFLPAGDTKGRPAAELLASARAKPMFRRMQNEFHFTIVDTPPATTVTDVGIIGQLCTAVIVVVRLHRTDEVAARRCVRLLQVNNVNILGCLLIGRDAPGGRYGYSYGYNYYRYYDHYIKDTGKK